MTGPHVARRSGVPRAGSGLTIAALERFPIRWNHLIEKESLKFKEMEHDLIQKVCNFLVSLYSSGRTSRTRKPARPVHKGTFLD